MKSKFVLGILMFVCSLFSLTSCTERIDAGSEGILVNLYGSDKGVDDVSLCTGRVWYNPFTEDVYEYPTYVQTVDYPAFTINADRKSTRLNSSHANISYAVFCLKKKNNT